MDRGQSYHGSKSVLVSSIMDRSQIEVKPIMDLSQCYHGPKVSPIMDLSQSYNGNNIVLSRI
jgi:hypothetical protein